MCFSCESYIESSEIAQSHLLKIEAICAFQNQKYVGFPKRYLLLEPKLGPSLLKEREVRAVFATFVYCLLLQVRVTLGLLDTFLTSRPF